MLYLKQPAASCGEHDAPLRLTELMAASIERALLAADMVTREHELLAAFTRDVAAASWLMTIASAVGPTPTTVADAVAWLAPRLEREIASAIEPAGKPGSQAESPAGNIESRLPKLAARLADYAGRIDALSTQLERQKLDALKELAYGASHEINNPLANIAARSQTLLDDETDPERRRKLVAIHRQAIRAHEMIADLMLFARPPKLNLTTCSPKTFVRQVIEELQERASQQGTRISLSADEDQPLLSVDTAQLAVAVRALIVNSLEALGEGGNIRVYIRSSTGSPQLSAEISVHDDGPGISDAVRRHLFDPFFSGREAGRGLGFGLSKCWRIVTDHGGDVVVQCPTHGGTVFSIRLPHESLQLTVPKRHLASSDSTLPDALA